MCPLRVHQFYQEILLTRSYLLLQVATQISLVLLLFGTMIGDFALLGDTGMPPVCA